jgi:hypothetical protein
VGRAEIHHVLGDELLPSGQVVGVANASESMVDAGSLVELTASPEHVADGDRSHLIKKAY